MNDTRGPRSRHPLTGPFRQPALSRRRFLKASAATGLWAGLGAPGLAGQPPVPAPAVLSGPEFDLAIGAAPVSITGRRRRAVLVNGSLPAPVLRFREGETVTLRVRNTLDEDTSIHWHGLLLPPEMDGVPGLSFAGIAPGETYTYRYTVRQSGTYWYHSHTGFQEQLGLYGAIVIDPADPDSIDPAERVAPDHDHVIVLSDWTDEDPHRIVAKLKKQADFYNFRQRTVGTFFRDAARDGLRPTVSERAMWGAMRMNPTDLADVTGYTYTFLVNGQPPEANWTALFRGGERVRLRFVNAAAMTFFDVRIPGLKLTVVATDGQPVEPVTVDEFRIGNAETYDVIVTPDGDRAYTIFAQAMDRTGYARGTLAPRPGMVAPVPAVDPRVPLAMSDMGMGHDGHGGHAGHGGDGAGAAAGGAVDHAAMGHDVSGSADVDHAAMGHAPASGDVADHAAMGHGAPDAAVDHAAMGHGAPRSPTPAGRLSPTVDMRATAPVRRLSDPGVGLRDNGRRVLTYADLRSRFADPDGREPTRTIELRLTGHMERYRWSFDGVPASQAAPIRLTLGERVRFLLVNDSMMAHPVHLHGLWSDLEDDEGRFLVRKHTIIVKPGEVLGYRVTADAAGRWAYHCHLLLHMDLGMFREVRVDG
jgi:CopA family copper-resistance protein